MSIETACLIAEVDGGLDAPRRAAISRLYEILNVDPSAYGLTCSDGDR